MMNLIDTHTHLYAEEFDPDRSALIDKALSNGISRFYMPNIDSSSIEPMLALEAHRPGICVPMIGLHPGSVNATYAEELAIVKKWLDRRRFAAIGEIGIDLYWDKTFLEEQKTVFRTQISWALEYKYPVVIHCRESFDEILEVLTAFPTLPPGIFHCFTGTEEQARRVIALGFKLGIGGVLTFKNSGLDKVIREIDLSHLVLETDAPYLSPVPFRGKRNEPAYLLEIARKLAEVKNMTISQVADTTTRNAESVFGNQ
jgi:TatD DNase family protein